MSIRKNKKFYTLILIIVVVCVTVGKHVLAENTGYSYKDILRLERVVNKISEFYVEEIDSKDLVQSAIRGLHDILDPHTAYFTEKDYNNLKVSTEGAFGGLGITIAIRERVLTIISPLQGTPAFRMGLQAGDKIVEIDGVSTEGITVDKAVEKLRGKPGTSVTIKIVREGVVEPLAFTVVRDIIKIKSVPFAGMLNDSIGYIKITQFSKRTSKDLNNKVQMLKKQGLTSLILDLRNNPGGLLNQAISVSDFFLDKEQMVVYTKGRTSSQNKDYLSKNNPIWEKDHRLIILINAGSASASEIVAGAVQDHDRGLIMGKTSFGKGSVQTILPLGSKKYALKLTTAYYYTPSGRCINKRKNAVKIKLQHEEKIDKGDSSKTVDSLEIFYTDAGRKVYAAGGITPDVSVEGNMYNRYVREMERKTMFFKFIIKNRKSIEDKGTVNLSYKIDNELRNKFKEYLYKDTSFVKFKSASHIMLDQFSSTLEKEREALGDTGNTAINSEINLLKDNLEEILAKKTKAQYEINSKYIDYALKRELIQAVKGDSARTVHEVSMDLQIKEAIKYLTEPQLYTKALAANDKEEE